MTWHTLQCLDSFIKILFLIFVKLTLALTTKSKDLESMYVAQRNLLCTSVLPKASSPIARSLLSQTHFFCSKKTTKTKPERLSLCFQVPVVFFRNIQNKLNIFSVRNLKTEIKLSIPLSIKHLFTGNPPCARA